MIFFKSLSIYTATSILNALIPFLLLPILTYYLNVEDYGLLAIIQIFIIFTIPFVSVNIQSTLQLEYHHLDREEFAIWISSVLVIPIVSLFFIEIVFIISETLIHKFIDISIFWIVIIPLIAFVQILPQVILSIYRISEYPINYAKYQLSLSFVNLSLTLLFVVLFKLNWEGRLLAILFTYLIFTVVGFYLLLKMRFIVFHINRDYIKKAFSLGLPLIVHVVSATLFIMSDRLFISYYLGAKAVGIYSIATQVAMIAMIIQDGFNQAWVPYLFRNLKSNNLENDIKIVKISYLMIIFFALLPFIVDWLSPIIFKILINDRFYGAMEYVFWIVLGYSFLGMYKIVTNYIFYEKRVKILSFLSFLSLFLNLILNYIFIQYYGAIGVAYATAITIGIFFIVAFIIANYLHKMPWLFFLKDL